MVRVQATHFEVLQTLTGIPAQDLRLYFNRNTAYTTDYEHLHHTVADLTVLGKDTERYEWRIREARKEAAGMKIKTARMRDDDVGRRLSRVAAGPLNFLPAFLRGYVVGFWPGKEENMLGMIEDAAKKTLMRKGVPSPTTNEDVIKDTKNMLDSAYWIDQQANTMESLEALLDQVDKVAVEGGSAAAHRYLTKFVPLFSGQRSAIRHKDDVASMLTWMSIPTVPKKVLELMDNARIPKSYAEIGRANAIELFDLLDADERYAPKNDRRIRGFTYSASDVMRYVNLIQENNLSFPALMELLRAAPQGERIYYLKMLTRTPQHLPQYVEWRKRMKASEFLQLVRDADKNLTNKMLEWDADRKIKAGESPDATLVDEARRKLARLGKTYRFTQVVSDGATLEEFCRHVVELPTPVLVPLLGDDEAFDGYRQRITPETFEKLQQMGVQGGNLYVRLRKEFGGYQDTQGNLVDVLTIVQSRTTERQPAAYHRMLVWGDLKPVQQHEIKKKVDGAFTGAELVFIQPEDLRYPNGDAVLFVTRRGKTHSGYERALKHYRGRVDLYYEARRVGVGSIVSDITNIQRRAA